MGRPIEFGKSWKDLFRRDDFCAQPLLDKLLFTLLIHPDECDHAGLGRITIRRWLKPLAPATEDEIRAALDRLDRAGSVIVDWDTEEYFAREFMVRDQIGKMPNTLANAAKSAAAVCSPKIAARIPAELARADVYPRSGNAATAERLQAALLAAEEHCRSLADRSPTPPRDPIPDGITDPIPDPIAADHESGPISAEIDPIADPIADPSVVVAVEVAPSRSVLQPTKETDYLTQPVTCAGGRESNERPSVSVVELDPPPTPPAHVPGPECATAPCGPCADTARATITDLATHTAERGACGLCDHHGRRIEPPALVSLSLPAIRCDHTPLSLDDWRRRATAPVPVRPGDWQSRASRKSRNSTKWTRTHAAAAAHDVPAHRNDREPLAS
ncbi:hypothetical protein [Nocardia sp. A7]|uniref:hypothetical protein n=1 Tax=Nocardia sp. A7 TaxID=2789274 RepID=UPI003978A517